MDWFYQYQLYPKAIEFHVRIHRKDYAPLLDKIRRSGQKILEVGAGPGVESLILQREGKEVTATDIDKDIPSKVLRAMGLERVLRCDTRNLPFIDGCFDVVFSSGLIEHFQDDDIRKMISEQLRVAKYVVVEVPLLEMRIITPYLRNQGERWMTMEDWMEKFGSMGFRVVDTVLREWKTMLAVVIC